MPFESEFMVGAMLVLAPPSGTFRSLASQDSGDRVCGVASTGDPFPGWDASAMWGQARSDGRPSRAFSLWGRRFSAVSLFALSVSLADLAAGSRARRGGAERRLSRLPACSRRGRSNASHGRDPSARACTKRRRRGAGRIRLAVCSLSSLRSFRLMPGLMGVVCDSAIEQAADSWRPRRAS